MLKKIGRNELCPCGSTKKYKRCHGNVTIKHIPAHILDGIELKIAQHNATRKRRQEQQGLGNSIISADIGEYKAVVVGNRIYYSKNFKTFHDFLPTYIASILDESWFLAEHNKSYENKHPILVWHHHLLLYNRSILIPGTISSAPFTGAVDAYLGLAYNLYCIQHNKELQDRLIHRLKNTEQFPGSYYETIVFGNLIRAGFSIEFEDESGSSGKKTECIATHFESGNKYSVEAKLIHRHNILGAKKNTTSKSIKASIADQIRRALSKPSIYPRIIFIELNQEDIPKDKELEWSAYIKQIVREKEKTLQSKERAYLIITNSTNHRHLDETTYDDVVLFFGFRIPDFGYGSSHSGLKDRFYAKRNHKDIFSLMQSFKEHSGIPATFDGDIEEFAFSTEPIRRFAIGDSHLIDDEHGNKVLGILKKATVIAEAKQFCGLFWVPEQIKYLTKFIPLNAVELRAYARHPDTFFGVITNNHNTKPLSKPEEMFDHYFNIYSQQDKEILLKYLARHPDLEKLKSFEQDELAAVYSELITINILETMKQKSFISLESKEYV